MERSGITALVNRIIREYYEFGNTTDMRDLLTDDVIAFGVISQYYVQGREPVLNFLADAGTKKVILLCIPRLRYLLLLLKFLFIQTSQCLLLIWPMLRYMSQIPFFR